MKNFVFTFIIILPFISLAQSAVMLPNGIDLPKVASLASCITTEKGRMVFNTTDNKAYYCNGTNWQEMTGGGFTLPYSGTAGSIDPILYIENSDIGRGIHAKTTASAAVRAESLNSYGLYGSSTSLYGVYGLSSTSRGVSGMSTSGMGVYGNSQSYIGGYFETYGNYPALYVYGSKGQAAEFEGNVLIHDKLTVNNEHGIVRNNTSTQIKIVRTILGFSAIDLAAGAYLDSTTMPYESFGGAPTVTIGQSIPTSVSGEWYKVLISPINVTETGCQFRVVNLTSNPITFGGTWNFLIVGPE